LVNVSGGNRDCSVCEDVTVPLSSFVESVSLSSESVVADRSSVLSHQVSVVLPPLLYGRSPPRSLLSGPTCPSVPAQAALLQLGGTLSFSLCGWTIFSPH